MFYKEIWGDKAMRFFAHIVLITNLTVHESLAKEIYIKHKCPWVKDRISQTMITSSELSFTEENRDKLKNPLISP